MGLSGLLGAEKRLMLSSAVRPESGFKPLTAFAVPFGAAAGGMMEFPNFDVYV